MSKPQIVKGALALAAIAALLLLGVRYLPLADWIEGCADWISARGTVGYLIFSGGYILGTMLFVPGSFLAITSGAVLGVPLGALVALLSATTGATLAFLTSRYLARGKVRAWIRKHKMYRALDEAIGERAGRIILLMRLSPVVPLGLSNYFFGVTKAPLWAFVLASLAGMAPGALLNASVGHVGMATFGRGGSLSGAHIALLVAGLLATAAFTWYLARVAKRELHKQHTSK
jgi:uncharacterized membrane protein YdjX (TVP38/TMEM64 family)